MVIEPHLKGKEQDFISFCRWLTSEFVETRPDIASARKKFRSLTNGLPAESDIRLMFACSVMLDMVARGWHISVTRKRVQLQPPSFDQASPAERKSHIRRGHLLERDSQLRELSVREFTARMEQRRLAPTGWHSIFSVMRDGRDLAEKLRNLSADSKATRPATLKNLISPYLQIIDADAECEYTGLKLIDIWRYFRHTWVNAYKSLPGRSMAVLVRDAAAPNHPVIGIAALGSSMAQQQLRDRWIGWESETFLNAMSGEPGKLRRWTFTAVDRLIDAIYQQDFLRNGVLSAGLLANPNEKVIAELLNISAKAIGEHRDAPHAAAHKSTTSAQDWTKIGWIERATTALFRAKRAKTLAQLLQIRLALNRARFGQEQDIAAVLTTGEVRAALSQLVRMVKAEHVGVDMMDIVVCGAIAPYNVLLGGKLICLLLTSPEIIAAYNDRYSNRPSVIASSMKGAPVVRHPNLVLLATTSLYSVGSSQYNRIRVPLDAVGGKSDESLAYVELGESKGYGSYQFSQLSLEYLGTLLGRIAGQKVNSIFGEGVNPLMRKIRDGLEEIGLPSDELLQHGNPRVVYGVPLARNFRDILLGFDENPEYLLPTRRPAASSEALAEFWAKRWLSNRIKNPGVLDAVERHSLCYPICHGARIPMQYDEEEDGIF